MSGVCKTSDEQSGENILSRMSQDHHKFLHLLFMQVECLSIDHFYCGLFGMLQQEKRRCIHV